MFKLLLGLHLLFAVFAIGPLVHAATTADAGVRKGDGAATASSARLLRIYSYVSVLVVIVGMALMSIDSPFQKGRKVGEFGDTWIWLSLLFWLAASRSPRRPRPDADQGDRDDRSRIRSPRDRAGGRGRGSRRPDLRRDRVPDGVPARL